MKVLSLFSGVGGFDLGLEAAGMETVFQCEWDKHCQTILNQHWPTVPKWDDVSTLTAAHILTVAPVIDVVAWGSPCQDLSVAGKRAGLGGERSGLFHQGIRIIKEMRELTNGKYPRFSIWENVAGALSSNQGADFGQILYEMDEAGACFSEWRLLDAQYFGVPQRRRRVFVISVFDPATAERCPNPLLPVSEGVQWHPATSTTTRQEPAGETPTSFGSSGVRMRGFGDYTDDDTASAIKARDWKDATDLVIDNPILIDRAAFNQGKNAQYKTHISDDPVVPSLVARGPHAVLDSQPTTAIVMRQREGKPGGGKGPLLSEDKSLTLAAASNDQTLFVDAIPIQDGREMEKQQNGLGVAEPGAPSYTLDQTGAQAVAIGFSHTQGLSAQPSESAFPTLRTEGNEMAVAFDADKEVVGTLRSGGDGGVPSSRGEHLVVAEAAGFKANQGAKARSIGYQDGLSQTLTSDMPGLEPTVLTPTMSVRRLTPLECERLMGWPDDWTAGQSDTHRYKQCGNGVASPVAQWIAQQLINL